MALRKKLQQELLDAVDQTAFSQSDFIFNFAPDKAILIITFSHQQEYFFHATPAADVVFINKSPGKYQKIENLQIKDLGSLSRQVTVWIQELREELSSDSPIYAELDQMRETLQKHIDEHVADAEEKFSREEISDLQAKLNALITQFEDLETKQAITEDELETLRKEVEKIKNNIPNFKKGIWYKTAGNKLLSVIGKIGTSKESRGLLAKAAQKMIGLD